MREDKLTGISDHMVIQWRLDSAGNAGATSDTTGWCEKKANWTEFRHHLEQEANNLQAMLEGCDPEQDLEDLARYFTGSISGACETSMPKRRSFANSAPLWTAELTRLRALTRQRRKAFQRKRGGRKGSNGKVV